MESCLTPLIGIKGVCEPATDPQVWLENIEGIDVTALSELATDTFPTGALLAEHLIASAATSLATDIESLLPKAYSIRRIISNVCSTCSFQPLYQTGKNGIIVKNVSLSDFAMMTIDKLQILTNISGSYQVTITDGTNTKTFSVTLVAGTILPVENVGFTTNKSKVEIYFTDHAIVPVATILCSGTSGCGCGARNTSVMNDAFTITGMAAGVESTTQFGFIPCVVMTCSQDEVMCRLINYSPRAFAAAMLYKTAAKYFETSRQSRRNNRTASFGNDEKDDLVTKYEMLYKEMLIGDGNRKGIAELINNNLSFIKDRCVECNSRVAASYSHG